MVEFIDPGDSSGFDWQPNHPDRVQPIDPDKLPEFQDADGAWCKLIREVKVPVELLNDPKWKAKIVEILNAPSAPWLREGCDRPIGYGDVLEVVNEWRATRRWVGFLQLLDEVTWGDSTKAWDELCERVLSALREHAEEVAASQGTVYTADELIREIMADEREQLQLIREIVADEREQLQHFPETEDDRTTYWAVVGFILALMWSRDRTTRKRSDVAVGKTPVDDTSADQPPGPDGEIRSDNLHFSITCPPRMAPGGDFILNVWAHLGGQFEEVVRRTKEMDRNAKCRVTQGPVKVSHAALLAVRLHIDGLVIKRPHADLFWEEEIANVPFFVTVPQEALPGKRRGVVSIRIQGLEIVRLDFSIDITAGRAKTDVIRSEAQWHKRPFASYAHEDRNEVLARIHGMKKLARELDVFTDVTDLRSGENWEERLREEIEGRDVLYLFWSTAASKSTYVDWEWRCALEHKGLHGIDPVPIELPCPNPPKELASLHFDDALLYFMSQRHETDK